MEGRASATTAAMLRNNSVWPRCGGSVAFADPIRFRALLTGPATPGGQVRRARLSQADRWKTTHAVHTHRSDDRSGHSVRRPPERSLPRSLVRGRKRRGDVRYDCSMRTLEQCVSLIIAGNRGFCNPNPYYRGPEAAPPGVKRKR